MMTRRQRRKAFAASWSWVPTDASGLLIWLDDRLSGFYQTNDDSTPVTADGQTVGRWSDNSGNGNHLVQATAGKRPLYKTAIQNGRAGVLLDGVDDTLGIATLSLTTFTILTVFKLTGTAGLIYEHASGGGENSYLHGTTVYTIFSQRGANASSKEATANWAVDNAAKLVSHMMDGTHAGHTLRADRAAVSLSNGAGGTANPGSGAVSSTLYLGSRSDGGSLPCNGHLFELLVYSPALSAANEIFAENYLQGRWATP